MTQEIINPFNRFDFDMCEHVEHHPLGKYVEWQDVKDEVQDGILLRRLLRLLVDGAKGDPRAVLVLEAMDSSNPANIDDANLSDALLRGFLKDVTAACDRVCFTSATERLEVEAAWID